MDDFEQSRFQEELNGISLLRFFGAG